ncbi:MAG TPA: hypothetical protein VHU23_14305 [Rhizomicrobium sp.]|jgi:biopolymer transport protein ExbD|nr:hypothetical protein [Rhizomicrobium sp.]
MVAGVSATVWSLENLVERTFRMRVAITAAILAVMWVTPALAKSHPLWLLPREHLRIDHGRVFDRRRLSFELQKLKRDGDCPPIHIRARQDSKFSEIVFVILELQKSGCVNTGFIGEENSN